MMFQEDRLDPMIYIFPRMTKCTFHKFGTSGEVEKHDALCILPLNIGRRSIGIFSFERPFFTFPERQRLFSKFTFLCRNPKNKEYIRSLPIIFTQTWDIFDLWFIPLIGDRQCQTDLLKSSFTNGLFGLRLSLDAFKSKTDF